MLEEPAGDPRRGEPRTEAAICLSIGGITTTIVSPEGQLSLVAPPPVSRFVVDGGVPDIRIEAGWDTDRLVEPGRLLFDSGGLWQLRQAGRQLAWTFRSDRFGRAPYKTAVFEPDFSAGSVYLHAPYFDASSPLYPLEYPLDELLITNWLALGRGVEIHGCAVRDSSGAGYLFAGHSGAGKSTMARLWHSDPGVTILSDDRVILRKAEGRIWMHGTPWHGDEPLASPTCTPLTRGFFLRHASRNHVIDVSQSQAVAGLLARAFPPFYSGRSLEFTLSFLDEVSRLTPFSELAFVPDSSAIDFVRLTI